MLATLLYNKGHPYEGRPLHDFILGIIFISELTPCILVPRDANYVPYGLSLSANT